MMVVKVQRRMPVQTSCVQDALELIQRWSACKLVCMGSSYYSPSPTHTGGKHFHRSDQAENVLIEQNLHSFTPCSGWTSFFHPVVVVGCLSLRARGRCCCQPHVFTTASLRLSLWMQLRPGEERMPRLCDLPPIS